MYYTVTEKSSKASGNGESYKLQLESRNYQCSIINVTKDEFDRVNVGDKIEIAFAPSREYAQEVHDKASGTLAEV